MTCFESALLFFLVTILNLAPLNFVLVPGYLLSIITIAFLLALLTHLSTCTHILELVLAFLFAFIAHILTIYLKN